MDAFTTILSYFAAAADEAPRADAPVESDSGSNSNGGSCTVAHRPDVDHPVDADSGSNSNGGSCVVA